MSTTELSQPAAPVIVLGMHRSGTSYLASVVAALGTGLGERMLRPAADNRRGYFEDEEFVSFHARIMGRVLGPTLSNHPLGRIYLREWTMPAFTPEECEESQRLVRERVRGEVWGWKDPRTCLFLPHWLTMFPDAKLVAVYRHPLEVYGSIVRRHSLEIAMDESLAIDTWTVYNRAILDALQCHAGPKMLLGAGELFQSPRKLGEAMADRLGLPGVPAEAVLPEFDPKDFRRWNLSAEDHANFSRVFPEAGGVFDRLQSLAESPLQFANNRVARRGNRLPSELLAGLGRNLALPVMAGELASEFAQERAQFICESSEYLSRRIEAADRYAAAVSIELPNALRRAEDAEARFHSVEASATVLRCEVTEWRARYLVAKAAPHSVRPIYLWGANSLGDLVARRLQARGIEISGVIDARASGGFRPAEFLSRALAAEPRPFVVVCSRSAAIEIGANLAGAGLLADSDFVLLPAQSYDHTELP